MDDYEAAYENATGHLGDVCRVSGVLSETNTFHIPVINDIGYMNVFWIGGEHLETGYRNYMFPPGTPSNITEIPQTTIDELPDAVCTEITLRVGPIIACHLGIFDQEPSYGELEVLPKRTITSQLLVEHTYNEWFSEGLRDVEQAAVNVAFSRPQDLLTISPFTIDGPQTRVLRFIEKYMFGARMLMERRFTSARDVLDGVHRLRFCEQHGIDCDAEKNLYIGKDITIDGITITKQNLTDLINIPYPDLPSWYTSNFFPEHMEARQLHLPVENEPILDDQFSLFLNHHHHTN